MAKYYGEIGFAVQHSENGVCTEELVVRKYCGDVLRNIRRLQSGGNVNDDISISNEISIVCDPYALQNFHSIRYATYLGTKWEVTTVELLDRPRMKLSLGGVYNG